MLKFLTKLYLLCTTYAGPLAASPDADGWVALAPLLKTATEETDSKNGDSSVWAIFSKQWDGEHFMVRFPEDPIYSYPKEGEMELSSAIGEKRYTLRIVKAAGEEALEKRIKEILLEPEALLESLERPLDNVYDIFYRKEGKWVAERYLLTSQHLYVLHSDSPLTNREDHQKFVDSLDILFTKN